MAIGTRLAPLRRALALVAGLRRRTILVGTLAALLIAVLAFHFVMTAFYLTPDNPVKLQYSKLVDAYMNPWFSQRWSLFAPALSRTSRHVMVACKLDDGDGKPWETGWIDIDAEQLAKKRRYKVTPADRIYRTLVATVYEIFGEDPLKELVQKLDPLQSDPSLAPLRAEVKRDYIDRYYQGLDYFTRVASAACAQRFGAERVREVRGRMTMEEIPAYSDRHIRQPSATLNYVRFPWAPFVRVGTL